MTVRVALAGNPNTGKTTLFNRLTGANARVGNYPGVTVELATATLSLGEGKDALELIDVPGAYSLVARSKEEQVAIECLLGIGAMARPDVAIFCVDATNLTRNLYLLLQAQELGLNTVVALTMVDEAGTDGPDAAALAAHLETEVVPVVARTGYGVDELKRAVVRALERRAEPRLRFTPSAPLAARIAAVRAALPDHWPSSDGLALWALMSLDPGSEVELPAALGAAVAEAVPDEATGAALDEEVVCARYRWIDQLIAPLAPVVPARRLTERADALLIHPVWGFLIFLATQFMLFQSLFAWCDPAISMIEALFAGLSELTSAALGPSLLTDLLVDGVIGGVGSVVVFLPQILLLFFFIGMMEDSGYMARVAYLMDRIMKSMGLHGRAFVPMLSGFACAVPAIMATRTMERQRDRLLTMMVVPLMTCSARLPVYTLVIGALFPPTGAFLGIPVQGGLMVAMYLFSVLTALLAAWVLSRTLLPAGGAALIMELPPYRLPRLADVLRMMWSRARSFLSEAGTVILACTIVLWALLSFPRIEPSAVGSHADPGAATATAEHRHEVMQQSYGARLGHAIEPALRPLGFDWKIGVGILGAFAAREVFVATMGVVYNAGDTDDDDKSLRQKLREERAPDGRPAYTPLVGLSLLVFFALACQCVSTLAVVRRETKSLRWPLFLFTYMTALAWLASFAIYQGGRWLGFG